MLAQCPNCGATVSTRSAQCPQCHGRLRPPDRDAGGRVFGWAFAAFNGLMLAWIAFYIMTGRTTLRTVDIEGDLAGTPVGGGLGIGFLLVLWGLGLVVLGLCALFNFSHRATHNRSHRVTR